MGGNPVSSVSPLATPSPRPPISRFPNPNAERGNEGEIGKRDGPSSRSKDKLEQPIALVEDVVALEVFEYGSTICGEYGFRKSPVDC